MKDEIIYHYTTNTSVFNLLIPEDFDPLRTMVNELNSIRKFTGKSPIHNYEDIECNIIKKKIKSASINEKILNMRATSLSQVNDSSELQRGLDALWDYEQKYLVNSESLFSHIKERITNPAYFNMLKENSYVISFSTSCDDLTQWRLYGDEGKGVCIGFDKTALYNLDDTKMLINLTEVKYTLDELISTFDIELKEIVNTPLAPIEMLSNVYSCDLTKIRLDLSECIILLKLLQILCCIKHEGFKNENEIRIAFLPLLSSYTLHIKDEQISFDEYIEKHKDTNKQFCIKNELIKSYRNIPIPASCIKEIWLGPKNNNSTGMYSQYCNKYSYNNIAINKSTLPYQ